MSTQSFEHELAEYLAAAPNEQARMDREANRVHDEVLRLVDFYGHRGRVTEREYRAAARAAGVPKSQLQRLVSDHLGLDASPSGRQHFTLSERHMTIISAHQGNVSSAYREMAEAGEELPSYSTFWRAWYDDVPKSVQAYARHGAEAMAAHWIYMPFSASERNAVWQADHFELPIDVIADGCTTTEVKPWLTLFVDDATRMVMGWSLVASEGRRPDSEQRVVATIASAIQIRIEHDVEVGGVPLCIRWDNDKSFTADVVTQFATRAGFEAHAVRPYSGKDKGKIERLGRRVQEEFVRMQPGYTHGPITHTRRNPMREGKRLTADLLRARLDMWFTEYNTSFHHSIGMTPVERWSLDRTVLRRTPVDVLRSALLVEPLRRKVMERKGVSFQGKLWGSAELERLVGKKVEIRYPVGKVHFIEAYRDGQWVATAWPLTELSEAGRSDLLDERIAQRDMSATLRDQALEIRAGAHDAMELTDAMPDLARMPAIDELGACADDLYELLGDDEGPEQEDLR